MQHIEFAGYTIDTTKIPHHLGVIMDGNGRWATNRGLTRSQGHREGVNRIEDLVRYGLKYQIKEISLYTFSTENWSRPKTEVNYLFRLIKLFFKKNAQQLKKDDVRIRVIGFEDHLPNEVIAVLNDTVEITKECRTLTLNLCFNYGGQQDITFAARKIAEAVQLGHLSSEEVTLERVKSYLKSAEVSSIDLLIRTSNEYRISNFLPWQLSYAEFLFIETHWPDFSESHFVEALHAYANRCRRFGGIKG
jgi:undecaprenyl diphosphate synthase